jgi:hypothetical protein
MDAILIIQFTNVHEDEISGLFGPYPYVQLTYDELWSPDREHMIASRNSAGYWVTACDNREWTGVTISSESAE